VSSRWRTGLAAVGFGAWGETVGERIGAPVIDPGPALGRAAEVPGLPMGDLFRASLHLASHGSDVMAKSVAKALVKQGLLPPPDNP